MYANVIMISATLDVIGYVVTSGSKPILYEKNDAIIVNNDITIPNDIVPRMTINIFNSSPLRTPKKRPPKTAPNNPITTLVSNVATSIASMTVEKSLVFPKNLGGFVLTWFFLLSLFIV